MGTRSHRRHDEPTGALETYIHTGEPTGALETYIHTGEPTGALETTPTTH